VNGYDDFNIYFEGKRWLVPGQLEELAKYVADLADLTVYNRVMRKIKGEEYKQQFTEMYFDFLFAEFA